MWNNSQRNPDFSKRCICALAVVTLVSLVSYAVALVRCGGSRDSVHAAQIWAAEIVPFTSNDSAVKPMLVTRLRLYIMATWS